MPATTRTLAYVDVISKAFGIQGRPFYPIDTQSRSNPAPSVDIAHGPADGRRPEDGQGLEGVGLHPVGRLGIPRPDTTGYDSGTTDDEADSHFPVIAPGPSPARARAAGDLPVLPSSRSRWP